MKRFFVGKGNLHGRQIVDGGEGNFKPGRFKVALFQLLRKSPNRPVRDLFHPGRQISISGRALKYGIAVFSGHLFHTGLYQRFSLFLFQVPKTLLLFPYGLKTPVNGVMEQISHIHGRQRIFLSLRQFQAIFQEMGVCAGCILFQARHAAA